MSARERLQKLQNALEKQGAVDVKFYLSADESTPLTEVVADVAAFLEASTIEDRVTPMEAFNGNFLKD